MAEILRYVNIASTPGGNGTTNGTSGADRAYATLAEWQASEQTDLVAAGDTHRVLCSNTGVPNSDVEQCIVSAWVTGPSNHITIEQNPTDRTFGVLDTTKYKMRVAFPDGCLDVRQNDVFVLYLQIERNQPAGSAGNKRTIQARSSGGKITIDSVILVNVDSTSTGSGLVRGFICGIPGDPLANNVQITNACALNFSHPTKNYTAVRTEDANGNHVVSNCCLINSDINMDVAGTSTISKNNVFQDGGTDVVGTLNPASDYNLTDAGSFPVGSNNVVNSVLTFINKAGNDFHLAESDTDAIRAGIGPSVDLDIPDFDVDGDSRAGDDTDIGYDHLFIEPGGTGARTWYHFFLGLTGLNSISFNDKAVEYLKSKGVSSTTLNGALNEWLGDKGYTGSLDDRIKQWGDDDFPE